MAGVEGLGSVLGAFDVGYDSATKQLGDVARARGLQALSQMFGQGGMPPPGGPPGGQPPMPQGGPPMGGPPMGGQPPPPSGPPMGGGAPGGMPLPGGPPGMPPGGGMPPQMQPPMGPQGGGFQTPGQGPLDWRLAVQAIQRANPGLPPNALAAAVDGMLPMMTLQSQQQWREMSMMLRAQQLDIAQQRADTARTQGEERLQQGSERLKQGEERIQQGEKRIHLAEARLEFQKDKSLQDLDLKRKALEERITTSKDRTALAQWRAIVEAQHKRMTEIIQSSSMMSKLSDEERKEIRKEADTMRDEAIANIRGTMGSSTPTGGTTTGTGPKVEGRAPAGTAIPGQAPGGPAPGTVMDGHRFKGGDPSKQENWEPVAGGNL